jgi:Phytochelatin synthase
MHSFCKEFDYEAHMALTTSDEGKRIEGMLSTPQKANIHKWLDLYEPQLNGCFCGLASLSIISQYLAITKASSQQYIYRNLVEGNIWASKDDMKKGLTLAKLYNLTKLVYPNFTIGYVPCSQSETAYNTIKQFDLNGNSALIINFCRNLKGHHGGHFSPVVGLCTDINNVVYVCIEDVSLERAKPHWIRLEYVSKLISTYDSGAGSYRGIITITKK